MEDCELFNAKKGHHIGMSENSAKELSNLIEEGILKPLTAEESNKIYSEQMEENKNGNKL
jgi:hypothetical protein